MATTFGSHKKNRAISSMGHAGKAARVVEMVPTRVINNTVGISREARGTMRIFKKTPTRLTRLNW